MKVSDLPLAKGLPVDWTVYLRDITHEDVRFFEKNNNLHLQYCAKSPVVLPDRRRRHRDRAQPPLRGGGPRPAGLHPQAGGVQLPVLPRGLRRDDLAGQEGQGDLPGVLGGGAGHQGGEAALEAVPAGGRIPDQGAGEEFFLFFLFLLMSVCLFSSVQRCIVAFLHIYYKACKSN